MSYDFQNRFNKSEFSWKKMLKCIFRDIDKVRTIKEFDFDSFLDIFTIYISSSRAECRSEDMSVRFEPHNPEAELWFIIS